MRHTRSQATDTSYKRCWNLFAKWCHSAGRAPIPAAPDTIAMYVTAMMQDGKTTKTATAHIAAIIAKHADAKQPRPETTNARKILTGTRRIRRETPKKKAAIDPSQLLKMAKKTDANTAAGARDRAALILGFATSLRRAELCALDVDDITQHSKGLIVLSRWSKTDQKGEGRTIAVFRGKRKETCPVRALRAWMKARGRQPGPLFVRITKTDQPTENRLKPQSVATIVQKLAKSIGLDPKRYGAHSLRAGATTTAAEAHRTAAEIMALTGHKSIEIMHGYIRRAAIFPARDPLGGVL
jgi:integrase